MADGVFSLRPATPDDLTRLAEMERQIMSAPWPREAIAAHLSSPVGRAVIACLDGCPAGYLLTQVIPPEFEILRVGVLPAFRRRGCGEGMLAACFADLAAGGCTDGYLEVRASNAPAIALYRRVGFAPCGLRPRYYRNPAEDAVCMTVRLTADKPAKDE